MKSLIAQLGLTTPTPQAAARAGANYAPPTLTAPERQSGPLPALLARRLTRDVRAYTAAAACRPSYTHVPGRKQPSPPPAQPPPPPLSRPATPTPQASSSSPAAATLPPAHAAPQSTFSIPNRRRGRRRSCPPRAVMSQQQYCLFRFNSDIRSIGVANNSCAGRRYRSFCWRSSRRCPCQRPRRHFSRAGLFVVFLFPALARSSGCSSRAPNSGSCIFRGRLRRCRYFIHGAHLQRGIILVVSRVSIAVAVTPSCCSAAAQRHCLVRRRHRRKVRIICSRHLRCVLGGLEHLGPVCASSPARRSCAHAVRHCFVRGRCRQQRCCQCRSRYVQRY